MAPKIFLSASVKYATEINKGTTIISIFNKVIKMNINYLKKYYNFFGKKGIRTPDTDSVC